VTPDWATARRGPGSCPRSRHGGKLGNDAIVGFADSVTTRRLRWPNCAHNGTVRPGRIRHGSVAAARLAVFCGVTLAVIALAPVVVLAGEPLRRYYLRPLNRTPLRMRSGVVQSRYGSQREVLRRMTRRGRPVTGHALAGPGDGWRGRSLVLVIIANPVLIVLTAPGRWTIDRVGALRSGGSGRGLGRFGRRGGDWPPPAGVREPRRPKPTAPASAVALAEPRQQHRVVPMIKASPSALSEPARRVGSFLGRMIGVLRLRVSRLHFGRC